MKEKVVILSGAGTSAESGLSTFRDADGLWEGHDVMEVASIEGWHNNPELVLAFYNERRRQLHDVEPNKAHYLIAKLEQDYDVTVITQNVDDLHERAGSKLVIHLHGELFKAKSSLEPSESITHKSNINLGDLCKNGSQLRPDIVWFGEQVPMLEVAAYEVSQADKIIIIGTSMQVYPAASLVDYAKPEVAVYYIDLNPANTEQLALSNPLTVITNTATQGMQQLIDEHL